jgi:hypothetical protein
MAITDKEIKDEVLKREKKALPIVKYLMPEAIGGREVHILKKQIPSKLYKLIESAEETADFELFESIIPGWLVKPEVTKENLYEILEDFGELTLILALIVEENTISGERIQELRKKVKKL